jgi:hypothetical protein
MRTLIQAGKEILPNFVISTEKPRNYPLGRVNIGVHRNHRLQISPGISV